MPLGCSTNVENILAGTVPAELGWAPDVGVVEGIIVSKNFQQLYYFFSILKSALLR